MVDEKVVETVEEAKKIDEKKMAFYENLRKKITGFIGESVGEYKFTEYLLALPDFSFCCAAWQWTTVFKKRRKHLWELL